VSYAVWAFIALASAAAGVSIAAHIRPWPLWTRALAVAIACAATILGGLLELAPDPVVRVVLEALL
jgi:hypothetical protein